MHRTTFSSKFESETDGTMVVDVANVSGASVSFSTVWRSSLVNSQQVLPDLLSSLLLVFVYLGAANDGHTFYQNYMYTLVRKATSFWNQAGVAGESQVLLLE